MHVRTHRVTVKVLAATVMLTVGLVLSSVRTGLLEPGSRVLARKVSVRFATGGVTFAYVIVKVMLLPQWIGLTVITWPEVETVPGRQSDGPHG